MRNLSSEYTKMKDKGRKGSKRSFKQYQHSSGESEPVNQKALKR